jgi:hypothetical protein
MTRRRFDAPGQFALPSDAPTSPAPATPLPVQVSEVVVAGQVVWQAPPPVVQLAVREVLGFPIRWLRALPLPTSLLCTFRHEGGRVVLATATPSVPGDPPAPAFVGPELDALALAAEHDRACEATVLAWCARKPAWRLTRMEAIGGLAHQCDPLGWTTERVLGVLGLQLDEVWV